MEPLIKRLERVFQALPGGQAHLEELPNGSVSGHVLSSGFEGLDYEARRRLIRETLDTAKDKGYLKEDELLLVSTLLTYTPAEWAVNPIEQ